MPVTRWLSSTRQVLGAVPGRLWNTISRIRGGCDPRRKPLCSQSEQLEDRTLLAINAAFFDQDAALVIEATADDSVAVTVDAGKVLVNGLAPNTGPLAAAAVESINVIGSSGRNVIDLRGVEVGDFINLKADGVVVDGGLGADSILGSQFPDSLRGNHGDDTIRGGPGADTINGGDGNDLIDGELDDDSLFGWDGNDTISGSDGDDTIEAGDGEDSVDGGIGNDNVRGDNGMDTLTGTLGEDTLNGGFGEDLVSGGSGDDVLFGGADADTLFGDSGNDRLNGQGGEDVLAGGIDDDTLIGGTHADSLVGTDGDDILRGNEDADTLDGGAGNDTAIGGSGADSIVGGEGNDRLSGGPGDDMMDGGDGDDTVFGQGNNDTLLGGGGADVLDGGGGNDVVQSVEIEFLLYIDNVGIAEGDTGTRNAVFNVHLTDPSDNLITVDYATADGLALVSDNDYIATAGTLTFLPGQILRTISVPVVGDTFVEIDETFFLNLTNPTGATLFDDQAVGTIINDDGDLPILSIVPEVRTIEGDVGLTPADFTVTLDRPVNQPVTVDFATTDGTAMSAPGPDQDYVAAAGTLTFPANTVTQTITVNIVGDLVDESEEDYFVTLSNPSNNAVIAVGQEVSRGVIIDDDSPMYALPEETLEITNLFGSPNYDVGADPVFAVAGDVDGDGDLDLVVANSADGTVTVLPNNGDGTFDDIAPVTLAVGTDPRSVVLEDLDGDGDLDLITANRGSDDVSVLLGNGDGTFAAATAIPVGTQPMSVIAADLDGDGDADLVTANQGSNNISVLLGNGDGTFAAAANTATGNGPVSVAADDLDGDGDVDLVTADNTDDTASVLLGNGDGTFAAATAVNIGAPGPALDPSSVTLGDWDNDGDPDLAVANRATAPGFAGSVVLRINDGTGSFGGTPPNLRVGFGPQFITTEDVNGDAFPDLITANQGDAARTPRGRGDDVSLLLNDPTNPGTFQLAVDYAVGTDPTDPAIAAETFGVAVADLNGDGALDMASANSGSDTVTVLLNDNRTPPAGVPGTNRGTFVAIMNGIGSRVEFPVGGAVANIVNLIGADIDSDGDLDLVTSNATTGDVSVKFNNGNNDQTGTFPFIGVFGDQNFDTAVDPNIVESGDLDGDGDTDLVYTTQGGQIFWLRNNGPITPRFAIASNLSLGGGHVALAVLDFDGDGDLDLATTTTNDMVRIYLNSGAATFSAGPANFTGNRPVWVTTGDLNGDGFQEIVTANRAGNSITVFQNVGGTFPGAGVNVQGGMLEPVFVDVADVDNDGDLDIITANRSGDDVTVLLNNGNATFSTFLSFPAGDQPSSADAVDLDADGNLDIVVANFGDDTISVLIGNGDGTFQPQVVFPVGDGPISIKAVGDLDGNGFFDVAVANQNSNDISILLNRGLDTRDIVELDPQTGAEIRRFSSPERTNNEGALAYDSTNDRLFFMNGGGVDTNGDGVADQTTLYEMDTNGVVLNSFVMPASATTNPNPDYDGLAVLNNLVYILDTSAETVVGAPEIIVFDPATSSINGALALDLTAVNPLTFTNITGGLAATSTGASPQLVILDDGGQTVFLIDPTSGSVTDSFGPGTARVGDYNGVAVVDGWIYLGTGSNATGANADKMDVFTQSGVYDRTVDIPFNVTALAADDGPAAAGSPAPTPNPQPDPEPDPSPDGPPPADAIGDTLRGGLGNDTLRGADGDDFIMGQAGDDILIGRRGDDTLLGGAGRDSLDGGAGNDSLDGGGGTDTTVGGAGNDTVMWQPGAGHEEFDGGSGFDQLLMESGSEDDQFTIDELDGDLRVTHRVPTDPVGESLSVDAVEQISIDSGSGNDEITVDDLSGVSGVQLLTFELDGGRDLLDASLQANDAIRMSVYGGTGDDTVIGGAGKDTIMGEDGHDSLTGGEGNDAINGGEGVDQLFGSEGDDLLLGGGGRDFIRGEAGDDTLGGGDKNDELYGGPGADSIDGGADDDLALGESGEDHISGGTGFDTLDGGWDDDTISGGDDNDSLTGDSGNDVLLGGNGSDTLIGGDGNDQLSGGDGSILTDDDKADFLNGNSGADTLRGEEGDDSLLGGAGDDWMDGGAHDDQLNGNSGADSMRGGEGHDRMRGGSGNDTLNGGHGNDLIHGQGGEDGVAGDDGDDRVNGGDGADTVHGGDGNDTLRGGAGKDLLIGHDGIDDLDGQGGSPDTLVGGDAADVLEDNGGTDLIDNSFQFYEEWIDAA